MPAYLLNFVRDISDREAVEQYWSRVGETYSGKGKALVAYAPFEVLEGDMPVWGVVALEFSSMQDARDWYYGPEYQEVKKLRIGAQDNVCVLAEGGWVPAADRRPPVDFRAPGPASPAS